MSRKPLNGRRRGRADPSPTVRIRLSVPASRDFLCVVRSTATHIGAHTTLPVSELEDLRGAAGEACVLVMDNCGPRQDTVDCRFDELADGIDLEVRAARDATCRAVPWIDSDSFGWTLLSALVDNLSWEADATSIAVHLTKRASLNASGPTT